MDKGLFERISKRIEGYKDDMVELQRRLVATPAIGPESGGSGELERVKVLEPLMRGLFDSVEIIKAPDERVSYGYRPSMIAKLRGRSDERTIWIMAHLDIVPAGNEKEWNTPPHELVVKDGILYGRGVEDNHSGIVAALFTAMALKEESVKPRYSLGVIFAAEEETGSKYGVRYVLDRHSSFFKPDDLFIVPDWGDPDGSSVEVAEKSIIWFKFKTVGKQTHGSTPNKGINAHRAAAHLICKMDELNQKYPQRDELFDPPDNTFVVTKKEANIANVNIVPGEDVVYFDCRMVPSVKTEDIIKTVEGYIKEIEERFGVKITCELPFYSPVKNATPTDSPIVELIRNAAKDVLNTDIHTLGMGGQTVGTWFRNKGLHTAVYSQAPENQHLPNEQYPISFMINNTKMMAHIFLQ